MTTFALLPSKRFVLTWPYLRLLAIRQDYQPKRVCIRDASQQHCDPPPIRAADGGAGHFAIYHTAGVRAATMTLC